MISTRQITLGHLDISQQGKDYVNEALDANRLSRGTFTDRLETMFAKLHEVEHAIFLNSGTSALQVVLAALKEMHGYRDEDEVIVPAVTFVATANAVLANNLRPVFVDVDLHTFNINPKLIKPAITPRTRAILPVHLFGLPADMPATNRIAHTYGLQVLEDSCETMFASVHDHSVGSWGDVACFSTYVAHLIVGGVGGLITTSDLELATLCRSLLAHGRHPSYLSIDDDNVDGPTLQRMIECRYRFDRVGYSYRATELEAALALAELERWATNIARRRENAILLTNLLRPLADHLQLPFIPLNYQHSFMMYPIVAQDAREPLVLYLEQNGIETRYLMPLLSQPIYQRMFPGELDRHPVARHLDKHGFFIGMHQGLTEDDIRYVADVFHRYYGASR